MRLRLVLTGAIAAFATAGLAQAATITESVSGILGNGSVDTLGLFATAGTDLSGTSVTYSFSYDPANLSTSSDAHNVYKFTNSNDGSVAVSVLINGHQFDSSTGLSALAREENDSGSGNVFQVEAYDANGNQLIENFFPSFTLSLNEITNQSAIDAIVHGEGTTSSLVFAFTGSRVEGFNVNLGAVASPEPGTMTLFGTALLLAGLYRRRRKSPNPV